MRQVRSARRLLTMSRLLSAERKRRQDAEAERDSWKREAQAAWTAASASCEDYEEAAEQLDAAAKALVFYAELGVDDIPYADTINDPPDVGRTARAALASLSAADTESSKVSHYRRQVPGGYELVTVRRYSDERSRSDYEAFGG
jgi:hypothetical protein